MKLLLAVLILAVVSAQTTILKNPCENIICNATDKCHTPNPASGKDTILGWNSDCRIVQTNSHEDNTYTRVQICWIDGMRLYPSSGGGAGNCGDVCDKDAAAGTQCGPGLTCQGSTDGHTWRCETASTKVNGKSENRCVSGTCVDSHSDGNGVCYASGLRWGAQCKEDLGEISLMSWGDPVCASHWCDGGRCKPLPEGAVCGSDAQCEKGMRCWSIYSGAVSHCTKVGIAGSVCDHSGESKYPPCGSGLVCHYTNSSKYEYANTGICIDRHSLPVGSDCTSTFECAMGSFCDRRVTGQDPKTCIDAYEYYESIAVFDIGSTASGHTSCNETYCHCHAPWFDYVCGTDNKPTCRRHTFDWTIVKDLIQCYKDNDLGYPFGSNDDWYGLSKFSVNDPTVNGPNNCVNQWAKVICQGDVYAGGPLEGSGFDPKPYRAQVNCESKSGRNWYDYKNKMCGQRSPQCPNKGAAASGYVLPSVFAIIIMVVAMLF